MQKGENCETIVRASEDVIQDGKKRNLTDVEKECLMGGCEVLSSLPPRQLRELHCADFQFPNGDTFVLKPKDVDLTSAEAVE